MPGLYPMPSPWSPAQDASPLQWWTNAQLDALSRRVAQAWAAWAHDWLSDAVPTAEAANGMLAHEWPDGETAVWLPLGVRGEAAAWIDARTDPLAALFERLFEGDASLTPRPLAEHGVAQGVASRAWIALAEALRGALALDSAPAHISPDSALFKQWSGGALLSLPLCAKLPRAMLLNAACVRAIQGAHGERTAEGVSVQKSSAAVFPLAQALANRMLPLRAELGSCELDLGSLESLRIGDVVPLPHRLDAPLLVSTGSNVQLCVGFLGRQDGFKAIELALEMPGDGQMRVDDPLEREV